MRSSSLFVGLAMISAAALAAQVDFKDPRRAVGRENDIRVDAELADDAVSSAFPIGVTYQIENLTPGTIAVADKVTDSEYDSESQTITLSIGAEVPTGPFMPHVVTIKPGQKHVFTGGVFVHVAVPSARTPWTPVPRFVQIKVVVLRDVTPFVRLIEQQAASPVAPALPNEMFDRWVDSSDSILLNVIPVRWKGGSRTMSAERERPMPGGTF